MSRAFAWLVAAVFCLPLFAPAADREIHVLFLEVTEPHEANRAKLQQMLKAEGYEGYTESEQEISMALTAGDLRRLFSARVVQRKREKSAAPGMASQPVLQGLRIPARFRKLIRRVYLDPQRS